ncbi:hypothetical protein, partial [Hydrogenophilus thermoluteolus]|uniref:hypothetical protein n=1 Tax=Hydrogenophilus thermoluteolus TaxID=297 RepID=UPI002552317C
RDLHCVLLRQHNSPPDEHHQRQGNEGGSISMAKVGHFYMAIDSNQHAVARARHKGADPAKLVRQ